MDLFHTHAPREGRNKSQRRAHVKKHTLMETLHHALVLLKEHVQSAGGYSSHRVLPKSCNSTFICDGTVMDGLECVFILVFTLKAGGILVLRQKSKEVSHGEESR